jgi:hypothetical protein
VVVAGVEAGHVDGLGPDVPGPLDAFKSGGQVERGQRHHILQVAEQPVVDDAGLVMVRSPVHDPVGNGIGHLMALGEKPGHRFDGCAHSPAERKRRLLTVHYQDRPLQPDSLGEQREPRRPIAAS